MHLFVYFNYRHKRFLQRRLLDKPFTASVEVHSASSSPVLQSSSDLSFENENSASSSTLLLPLNNSSFENQENIDLSIHCQIMDNCKDQECQAEIFVPCEELDKVFSCSSYYTLGQNTCDSEIQTELRIPAGPVIITNHKRFKNQCCGTPPKIVKDAAVGLDLPTESKTLDQISFEGCVTKDEELNDLTGVTFNTFKLLLKKVNVSKNTTVTKKKRLFIFLVKMKLGLTFSALSGMFSLHRTTISKIFHSVLTNLVSATQEYIFWPDRLAVQATMPECFKPQFSDTRVIIDCTEFRIEVPSTVENRVYTFSHYKKSFTAKVLIGITPGGFISFKSLVAGGRKSDSQLTIESGLIDLLEDGDAVLADKGFPDIVTTLDSKGKKVILVMPPFLENKSEFDEEETEATYTIARVRIHVERIMQRLRTYHILNQISENLFDHIDHIVHMCCVLVNLQSPIFADKTKNKKKKVN